MANVRLPSLKSVLVNPRKLPKVTISTLFVAVTVAAANPNAGIVEALFACAKATVGVLPDIPVIYTASPFSISTSALAVNDILSK